LRKPAVGNKGTITFRSNAQRTHPISRGHTTQKTLDLVPDNLLLASTHIEFGFLEHRDGHAAVARVDDVRLSGEVVVPAVLDVRCERIDVKVHAGEDEGEVGQLCAGRSVRVGEVHILHNHSVRSSEGREPMRRTKATPSGRKGLDEVTACTTLSATCA
jgi:hypothetical protein